MSIPFALAAAAAEALVRFAGVVEPLVLLDGADGIMLDLLVAGPETIVARLDMVARLDGCLFSGWPLSSS